MPENILLLLPFLGGYVFTLSWNRTKWYAARWEKERLLLNSAIWGLFFTAIAYLSILAEDSVPCFRFLCFPRWPMDLLETKYLGMSLLATLLAIVTWIPLNLFWTFTNQEKRILKEKGTLLDILVDDSARQRKGVLITLQSGKVYAGIVLSAASPGHSRPMIKVLPTYSGYRNKDTQQVIPTTNYSQSLEDIDRDWQQMLSELEQKVSDANSIEDEIKVHPDSEKQEKMELLQRNSKDLARKLNDLTHKKNDLGILIPVDQIVTISLYHADLHQKYFVPREKTPPLIGPQPK